MFTLRSHPLNRRAILRTAVGSGWVAFASRFAQAADFWNKKESSDWSPQEIDMLKTKSPWARKVHGEIAGGGRAGGSGGGGGSRGGGGSAGSFGGMSDAESNGISSGGGGGRGGGRGGGGGSSDGGGFSSAPQGPEVVIRWENAEPMLAATKFQLPPSLANHYAISITGLPPQMLAMVMMGSRQGGGRGRGRDGKAPDAPPTDAAPATPEEQAAQAKARQDRLLHAVTLTARGRDPQVADTAMQTSDKQTIIFGFSKDAFPIAANDKDLEFAMKTGLMTIKAKFEPKEMIYKGALTV